jgi:hypothetical protein
VVGDGGGDHAEADAEEGLLRDLVAGLEAAVEPVVGGGQPTAAIGGGAGDVAEPGVVPLGPPRLGLGEPAPLDLGVDLLEHGDVVVALAPGELLPLGPPLGVGVEEGDDLGAELVEGRGRRRGVRGGLGGRHAVAPSVTAGT